MPRVVLRAAVLALFWPACLLSTASAQAPAEEDIVVENQPGRLNRSGVSGWWQRQVEGSRNRHAGFGRRSAGVPHSQENADDIVVPPQDTGSPAQLPVTEPQANPGSLPATEVSKLRIRTPNAIVTPTLVPAPPGYATLGAPLYPCPQPGIPLDVGATMITNPALYPHEMLYPHEYCALYPPFYHRTKRAWVMTPLGVYKSEKRCLTGTEVHVKYKSYISPCTLFWPHVP